MDYFYLLLFSLFCPFSLSSSCCEAPISLHIKGLQRESRSRGEGEGEEEVEEEEEEEEDEEEEDEEDEEEEDDEEEEEEKEKEKEEERETNTDRTTCSIIIIIITTGRRKYGKERKEGERRATFVYRAHDMSAFAVVEERGGGCRNTRYNV